MSFIRQSVRSLLVCLVVMAFGCGAPQLIPTPNLFVGSDENPFAEVPEVFQNNKVDVLYATDRQPVEPEDEDDKFTYDWRRSLSLAFGSAIVEFGEDITWDELVSDSRTDDREHSLPVVVTDVIEKGRFPETPLPVQRDEYGGLAPTPEAQAEHDRVTGEFHREVQARLKLTPKKEVYIFIHGYNNGFNDAVSVMGELWHFLGRQGVPVAYSWPAGVGGLRGYFYDRESGEYTIYHLKRFLAAIATCEGIEGIHLISHSRGTDVLVTALREIFLEHHDKILAKAFGNKVKNIVLAAPDLDFEVISQRLIAERFLSYASRLTIYMSTTDAALGLSTWLFLSQRRVGRIQFEDLGPLFQGRAAQATHASLVDARVDSGLIGHSYFYSHPAVLSDLVLLLRDKLPPGKEHGRPLENTASIFWRMGEDYPNFDEE